MFMVASSVVSTILILNYHHRNADTHEMSDWVSSDHYLEHISSWRSHAKKNKLSHYYFYYY
jgi:hypothetical protein